MLHNSVLGNVSLTNQILIEVKFQDCSGGGIYMVIYWSICLEAIKYSEGSPENSSTKQIKMPRKD